MLAPEPDQVVPIVIPAATRPPTTVPLLASILLVATFMVVAWGTLGDDAVSAERMLLLPLIAMLLGGILLRVTRLRSRRPRGGSTEASDRSSAGTAR